jgi:hypothetical protein
MGELVPTMKNDLALIEVEWERKRERGGGREREGGREERGEKERNKLTYHRELLHTAT